MRVYRLVFEYGSYPSLCGFQLGVATGGLSESATYARAGAIAWVTKLHPTGRMPYALLVPTEQRDVLDAWHPLYLVGRPAAADPYDSIRGFHLLGEVR